MNEIEYQQLLYTQILLNLMQQNMNELISDMEDVESKLKALFRAWKTKLFSFSVLNGYMPR